MKDSQKKKIHKKKKRSNTSKAVSHPISTQEKPKTEARSGKFTIISRTISKITGQFIWIIVTISMVNLILGIIVVYLIGKIEQTTLPDKFQGLNVPELPIFTESSNITVSADSIMVYEKDSRSIVYQKRGELRFAPASTTKIMTALVVLEHYEPEQYLRAEGVSTIQGSKMGLVEGEEITVKDLLYGLMLPSGNDAAYVLASNYPGGQKAFVKRMNNKAKEYRLFNTEFRDPAGLDDRNYTTAFDLARLAVFALENKQFKDIVETKNIVVFDKSFVHMHELENLNRLLKTNGVFGVKTGYTDEAGQVLVTSMISKGKTYIIVVLKSEDRFTDTELILREIIEKVQLEAF